MLEYRFIIPIIRDYDRVPHSEELWDALHDRLIDFGGYTVSECRGAWRNDDGKLVHDCSRQYVVATSLAFDEFVEEFLPLWRKFGQQCIYVASGSYAKLVYC